MIDIMYFIQTNLILIAYIVLGIIVGGWLLNKLTKNYLLKEVYLAENRGDRKPRLMGRQIIFAKEDSNMMPDGLKERDSIKAYMVVREGLLGGNTTKVAIPDFVEVDEKSNKTTLYNAKGFKHDYDIGCAVPFNEYVEANSPSETVIYDEIERKLSKTDDKVTRATVCSWRSKEWHNMYNSIPIDVNEQGDDDSDIVKAIDSTEKDQEKARREAKKSVEQVKDKFSDEEALDELGGIDI